MTTQLPTTLADEAQLDEFMTRPSDALKQMIRTINGPLIVLGAGGKMGPTLAALAQRAAQEAGHSLDVIAVSRYSNQDARQWLESRGVRTLSLDLLDRNSFAQLPDATNVIYLVGMKFGTTTHPERTWAINSLVPVLTCERFRDARISAVSTGNVYPLAAVSTGGSLELDPLTPLGEYANAAVARERMFEYGASVWGTRVAQLRLSYALDLRYGVVADIARKVWLNQPIDLATGHFNGIWQGDANEFIVRALDLATNPVTAFNLTSRQIYSVRDVAQQLGRLLNRTPTFVGNESGTAFVSNTDRLTAQLGEPTTPIADVLRWAAEWTRSGGRTLNKPTHFEVRDGKY